VFQEEERTYYDFELEKSHLKVKKFLKAQGIGKLHWYLEEEQCKLENKVL